LVAFAVVVVILLIAPAALASRSEKEEEFEFHIGDKFLAKFGLGGASVAQADNGDKIYIVGSAEFEVDEREAEGRGTFQHFSSTGTLIASGTWKATRLLSFVNFGGEAGLPPDLRGGTAVLKIRVVGHPAANPHSTVRFNAILTIDCEIGNFPPGFMEGITLNAGFINFDQKVSGFNVFIAEDED